MEPCSPRRGKVSRASICNSVRGPDESGTILLRWRRSSCVCARDARWCFRLATVAEATRAAPCGSPGVGKQCGPGAPDSRNAARRTEAPGRSYPRSLARRASRSLAVVPRQRSPRRSDAGAIPSRLQGNIEITLPLRALIRQCSAAALGRSLAGAVDLQRVPAYRTGHQQPGHRAVIPIHLIFPRQPSTLAILPSPMTATAGAIPPR